VPEVVNVRNFLISIRETGYRSFAHTIAELVDNSLQAGATHVSISIVPSEEGRISVTDNGAGMAYDALRTADRQARSVLTFWQPSMATDSAKGVW
jgi:DNA gyrase/topoisomerase IV subunit B